MKAKRISENKGAKERARELLLQIRDLPENKKCAECNAAGMFQETDFGREELNPFSSDRSSFSNQLGSEIGLCF